MKRPTKQVLAVCDEIDAHGDNNMDCQIWAAAEILSLRKLVKQGQPLIEKYAAHTEEGSQYISTCKQRKQSKRL